MRTARTVIFCSCAVLAAAAWWGFSGGTSQPANAQVSISAGDCTGVNPTGVSSDGGKKVTYPAGTKKFCIYWQSTGSGEGANDLRNCTITGNKKNWNAGVLSTTTLQGAEGVPFAVQDGDKFKFSISCKSKVEGEKTSTGQPLAGNASIEVEIKTSPPPPGGEKIKPGTLPGTVSPPKPEYREL